MSVTHANGNVTEARKDLKGTLGDLTTQTKERAADLATQTKDVARRRPVPLVTAAAAGVATAVVAVITVMRRRKAKQTPRQKAVNAWRRTSKSVRKRVKR
ncbi:hypothetical protein [Dactylosporangium salmoneum]|uniref:DUF3618 domain-containing protein n=1 Tax=Dactylosporangium salmoneum TaxID=53361 RepID=A0ABN3FEY3_9ACTN